MEKLVRKIGLVAHDAMKKDLIEWVLWNSELLMGHKFYCTGTTVPLSSKPSGRNILMWSGISLSLNPVLWAVTSRWARALWTERLTIFSFSPTR